MEKGVIPFACFAMLCSLVLAYPVVKSCEEARKTGIYTLEYKQWSLDVICDMETDGGGYLVILHRQGGHENFFGSWMQFRDQGIGSVNTEYFLPL